MQRLNVEFLVTPGGNKRLPVFQGSTVYTAPSAKTEVLLIRASDKEITSRNMLIPNNHNVSQRAHELIKNGVIVLLSIPESKIWGPGYVYRVQGVDQNGKLIFPQIITKHESDAIAMFRSRIIIDEEPKEEPKQEYNSIMKLCVLESEGHKFGDHKLFNGGGVELVNPFDNPDLILLLTSPDKVKSYKGKVSMSGPRATYLKARLEEDIPVVAAVACSDGKLCGMARVDEIDENHAKFSFLRAVSISYIVELFRKHHNEDEVDRYLKGGVVKPIEDNDLVVYIKNDEIYGKKVNPLSRILPQVKQSKTD